MRTSRQVRSVGMVVILLFMSGNVAASLLTDGLVAHYKLDGISGAVVDEEGNYDGVNIGATRGVPGKFGNAFEFDGSDVYVSTDLIPSKYATASMWIRPEAGVVGSFLGTLGTSDWISNGWAFTYEGEDERVQIKFMERHGGQVWTPPNGQGGQIGMPPNSHTPSGSVPLNEWSLITVVVDDLDVSVFVGDTIALSIKLTSSSDTHDRGLMIGRNYQYGAGGNTMVGLIDDVSIWNRALSEDEVAYVYAYGIPEPMTMSLLLLGGFVLRRRRKA